MSWPAKVSLTADTSGNATGLLLPSGMTSNIFSSIPGRRVSVSGDSELGSCLQTGSAIYNGLFNDGVSPGTFKSSRSFMTWANMFLGQRLEFVYNGGLSGKRTDEILANLSTVLAMQADLLIENGGANDTDQLTTYAGFASNATTCENAIFNNRTASWARARARGVRLIIAVSITPSATGQNWTATQKGIYNRVNRRLANAARAIPGVIWFDASTYIADPASTTGLALAGTLYDNLHYSTYGSFLIGRALARVLDSLLPRYTRNLSNWLDCWQSDTSSNNLMEASCGMFTKGTAGTAGTGVVGTVCTGWTLARTGQTNRTVTLTIAALCVVTLVAHGYAANTPVTFSTTGALPTGLVAGTVYYVLSVDADNFQVSATPGGIGITTTGTQSGVQSVTSATAVASLVTAPNDVTNDYAGVGNAQRLVITTAAQNDTFRWFYSPTINISQFPAGNSFYIECRIRVRSAVNVNIPYAQASAYFTGGAVASPQFSADGFTSYSEAGSGSADLDMVLRSTIVVLPSDATAISSLRFELYAKFNGAGAGTIVDLYDAQMVWNR